MAMQQETKAAYAKYGVSPTGSVCTLIQMPILFVGIVLANVPAYVNQAKRILFRWWKSLPTQPAAEFLSN